MKYKTSAAISFSHNFALQNYNKKMTYANFPTKNATNSNKEGKKD